MSDESKDPKAPGTYLCVPCHEPVLSHGTALTVLNAVTSVSNLTVQFGSQSLLARNFNHHWCEALNLRESRGLRYFVMIHGDIHALPQDRLGEPLPCWLSHLTYLLERENLDALSAVVPIKEGRGEDTSTGGLMPDGLIYRLNQQQLAQMPQTFSAGWFKERTVHTLLINTGLLVMRLDRPWCEEFLWTIRDTVQRDEDGKFFPNCVSEDWGMSLWFAERGIPYGCTTEIPIAHQGCQSWVMGGPRK